MGIINDMKKQDKETGIFAVVAGARTSGKSTIPGTLPGKTLMLQASVLETGSKSALGLAKELGNDLTVLSFDTVQQLGEYLEDSDLKKFDNLYIDGLSAITEQLYADPAIGKVLKKNVWDGFREIWEQATRVLLTTKKLSQDINVFFSLAIKEKWDRDGNLIAIEPEIKGNATMGEVKKLCPTILYTIGNAYDDEDGKTHVKRQLVTGYMGVYAARIDSLLDHQNPGIMDADLGKVIALIKGE